MLQLLFLTLACGSVNGAENVFTSVNSLQNLVTTETNMIQSLKDIVTLQEEKISRLQRYVSHYEQAHEQAVQEGFRYLTNPLNGYQLIKRLTSDWTRIVAQVESPVVNITRVSQALDLPTMEDLAGAADGLCRLLQTYKLDPTQLARGVIDGVQYSQPMSAHDSFEIGRNMYILQEYYDASVWFKIAQELNRVEAENSPVFDTSRAKILDFLAFSVGALGHARTAVELTQEYLTMEPNCVRNQANLDIYLKQIQENKTVVDPVQDGHLFRPPLPRSCFSHFAFPSYERLCRGEVTLNHKLVCRYEDNNNPYFFLGKLKLEEMNLEPPIVLFHEVIFDSEINKLIEMARVNISRSMVKNRNLDDTNKFLYDNQRISMTSILLPSLDKVVEKVDRRAAMLSNLTDLATEALQVLNYGIGGYYSPHVDHSEHERPNFGFQGFTGNRIATLFYYLSDVERGGATVFPYLDVAVVPRKGSALMWYNLFRDGSPDARTMHAGCPVLMGSKWGANKWFHEETQEFVRPCLLKQDSLFHKLTTQSLCRIWSSSVLTRVNRPSDTDHQEC